MTFTNLSNNEQVVPTITEPDDNQDEDDPNDEDQEEKQTILEKMMYPIDGEYEIVRYYYDTNNPGTIEDSVLSNGTTFIESNGISFAKNSDASEEFGVMSIFSGLVIDVGSSILGQYVTIDHGNDIIASYYSLKDITVELGDEVSYGQVFANAAYSSFDIGAGLHVHLEIQVAGEYINPIDMYDQEKDQYEK